MQYFIRLLIAAVVYLAFMLVFPAALHLFGVALNPDLDVIIRVVGGLFALYYVIWGWEPPFTKPAAP